MRLGSRYGCGQRQGIAYAEAGRLTEARARLEEGDASFDVASRENRPGAKGPRSRESRADGRRDRSASREARRGPGVRRTLVGGAVWGGGCAAEVGDYHDGWRTVDKAMKRELPSRRERFEVALRLVGPIESALGRRADVVVLNDAPPLLASEIVTLGRRILCQDTEADHAFARDAQLRAADVAPFLERARRVKLSVLAE